MKKKYLLLKWQIKNIIKLNDAKRENIKLLKENLGMWVLIFITAVVIYFLNLKTSLNLWD